MGELDLTLGAVEIGIILATMAYGMTIVQSHSYANRCGQDPLWMKLVVLFLGVCETAHSIVIWAYLYSLTVSPESPLVRLLNLPWTFAVSIALSGLTGGTTQAFFTYRVFRISRKLWLAAPAWLGAAARVGISFALMAFVFAEPSIFKLRVKHSVFVYASLGVSTAVDVWNSALLCWFIKTSTADTSTRGVVNAITRWAIETGLTTTAAAILVLVCWITMPDNCLWLGAFFVYSKLYTSTLMLSLNARERLRVAANLVDGISITRTFEVQTAPPAAVQMPLSRRYRASAGTAASGTSGSDVDTELAMKATLPYSSTIDEIVYGEAL